MGAMPAVRSGVEEPLLPREMALFALVLPPILYLLLDDRALREPIEGLRGLANISAYTALCITVTHLLFELPFARLHRRLAPAVRALVYAAGIAIGVTAVTLVVGPYLREICVHPSEDVSRLAKQGVVISWLYATGGLLINNVRSRLGEARARALAEQTAALDARLRALTARTHPHFLFNSLNAGMSLIATDPQRAEELFGRLSALFRYALEGSSRRTVSLDEELAAIRDYLEIEKTRFGDRLTFAVESDPGLATERIPPMLLQPLAENAVLHGVAPRVAGGHVAITIARDGEHMIVEVCDDGGGPQRSSHRGTGTSLDDLRERIAILYGGRATFETRAASPAGGFLARLRIPLS